MDKIILNKYNDDDKILIAKIIDKIKFCDTKNKIQTSSFMDLREQNIIEKILKSIKINNYFFYGGFEDAERKMIVIYPKKLENILSNIDLNEFTKVIRVNLPNDMIGQYNHRNYLGGLMKLGISREKIGDIIVDEKGADIIVCPETTKFLLNNISSLTRFSKSKIDEVKLENIRKVKINKEIISITIPSMRLDNIVSELAKCSRGKANEILEQERVLVNYEIIKKSSKEIKENDKITIRGKGKFEIRNIVGNTRSGRIVVEVEKFC